MKKLLLLLGLSPLAVMGQQYIASPISKDKDVVAKFIPRGQYAETVSSPVRITRNTPVPRRKSDTKYKINAVKVGTTYYDLMSNASMPRRVETYPGGKVSVVWTNSSSDDKDFPDRGTAYNHFDGTSWIGQVNRDPNAPGTFEPERAGWPNILSFDSSGTQREMIISHYASGGTGVSGGTFWMTNSRVGDPAFTTFQTVDKPDGPIWPRTAITGDVVHLIGAYSDTTYRQDGVKTPVVYYRYNLTSNTFEMENVMLPGYKERYAEGTGDEYSIDARGNTVAILIGGTASDLTLWKSTDKGQNWTKTIIDSFPLAPYDRFSEIEFDTVITNDGTGTVTLDKDGVAHVFYPQMRVFNFDLSDNTYNYSPGTDGIVYWNDKTKTSTVVAGRINYDQDVDTDILDGNFDIGLAGYSNAISTYPVASIDDDNNIYMVYSSPNEEDIFLDESNYRDLYVIASTDGGESWSEVQSITNVPLVEDVFPSVSRDATDGKLHLLWMTDETPGIFLVNNTAVSNNEMMYAEIPTEDILEGKLKLARVNEVGIKETAKSVFAIGDVYPNPATGLVNIPVRMKTTASVSVKVMDLLGKVVSIENTSTLSTGQNLLSLNIANLTPGVYFCQVSAAGYSQTQKIVVK